ncbi:MAG: electron transfer flavoprotein subunit alpha/FixB family protein [Anaerolineae bacterium]|nr:electron transfer flavoprotein subunit alpha/FixB family protein [Anaerolineae bacterium]
MVKSLYGVEEAVNTIWVFVEQSDGVLKTVSLELLAKARELANGAGWPVTALLMGADVRASVPIAFAHGADEVRLAEHPLLADFTVEGYAHVACEALLAAKPSAFLLGATPDGRDLAGRLAVRLRTGLNADCTDLRLDPETGVMVSEVSGFGGGVLALLQMQHHRPQMATFRPGVFPLRAPDPSRHGNVVPIPVTLTPEMLHTHVIERVVGAGLDLSQAPVLVIGGRGVEGDFDTLRELAARLGGEVGATRPPVDEGYIERARQIGQTGVVCRPKLALVCGVSGAFHFVVGIRDAETVIAINNDPEAEIFKHADYCVIGDVREVLPAVLEQLKLHSGC